MAVPKLYKGLNRISNDYGAAFVATYREAKAQSKDPSFIPFSKAQLVYHGSKLVHYSISKRKLVVKNFPDALYTFRARAEFPAEILADGHFAIIGQGKGLYAFVSIPFPNRFGLPVKMKIVRVQDKIPAWGNSYISKDEQGMLTKIQNNDLLSHYLGLDSAFRLQSHLRIGVKKYGQVEVDELYVGRTKAGEVGIAVEAKSASPDDCINVSQLFGTAQALRQLFASDMPKHLIGAKPDTSNRICLAEFSIPDHPAQLKQIRDWCAYELV